MFSCIKIFLINMSNAFILGLMKYRKIYFWILAPPPPTLFQCWIIHFSLNFFTIEKSKILNLPKKISHLLWDGDVPPGLPLEIKPLPPSPKQSITILSLISVFSLVFLYFWDFFSYFVLFCDNYHIFLCINQLYE